MIPDLIQAGLCFGLSAGGTSSILALDDNSPKLDSIMGWFYRKKDSVFAK